MQQTIRTQKDVKSAQAVYLPHQPQNAAPLTPSSLRASTNTTFRRHPSPAKSVNYPSCTSPPISLPFIDNQQLFKRVRPSIELSQVESNHLKPPPNTHHQPSTPPRFSKSPQSSPLNSKPNHLKVPPCRKLQSPASETPWAPSPQANHPSLLSSNPAHLQNPLPNTHH